METTMRKKSNRAAKKKVKEKATRKAEREANVPGATT